MSVKEFETEIDEEILSESSDDVELEEGYGKKKKTEEFPPKKKKDSSCEDDEEIEEEEEEGGEDDEEPPKKKKPSDDEEDDDEEEFEESVSQEEMINKILEFAKFEVNSELGSILENENISEEFQQKAITIFENAVSSATRKHLAKVDEYITDVMESAIEEKQSELEEQAARYMDYVVKEWREENHLAIQSGVRAEVAESFMNGLADLLESHFVSVPEEKEDVYNTALETIEELESSVQEQVDRNIALENEIENLNKKSVLESFVSGMTETKAEKIRELAEELSFESEEDFLEKLGVLKENYFPAGRKVTDEDMITEDADGDVRTERKVGGTMANYMAALSQYKSSK